MIKQHNGMNVLDRANGASYLIVNPMGCSDVIGIGFPGQMNYFRVSRNSRYIYKANRATVSSASAETLYELLTDTGNALSTISRIKEIIRKVKPTRNPFSAEYLALYPELA